MGKKKSALITGIAGQDGSYLSELLLEKGYNVYGTIRRHSSTEGQFDRLDHIRSEINLEYGDLIDSSSLEKIIRISKPDEIYNLAAQSHVKISFDIPEYTTQVNAVGLVNLLEAYLKNAPKAKFYQASSSEMFGNNKDPDGFQRETTPMNPVSPYGCTKLFGHNIIKNYRNSYNLFACSGILFNHEGPRRGLNFVTNKIVKSAVEIKYNLKNNLFLGNLDSYRDWGHSKDYVRAMWMMLQHESPDDYVVATGECHSVRDFCKITFNKLDMDYEQYVKQDPKFMRPEELNYLKGDASKIQKTLNWEREYSFDTLIDDMINYWKKKITEKSDLDDA